MISNTASQATTWSSWPYFFTSLCRERVTSRATKLRWHDKAWRSKKREVQIAITLEFWEVIDKTSLGDFPTLSCTKLMRADRLMGSWVLSSCNPRFLCPIYMEMYGESQGKIFNQISAGKRGNSSRLETRKHRRIHRCLNCHFRNNQSERYMNLCNSVPFWTPVADIRH